jgi:endonuclease YncB( thermonuclease family)
MIPLRIVFISLLLLNIQFKGKVVAVVDGDTLKVLKNGKEIKIRLNGIDCPEKSQAFGTKAKEFASKLVFDKNVVVEEKELDRYGRTIADVFLEDGTWLNKALIENGYAWHYKRYSSDQELAKAEVTARNRKVGLWQDESPVAPWDYRKK